MASLYEAFSRGRERGTERRKQSQLGELMQPALAGDQAAQSKMYGIDPQAAMQAQAFGGNQRKAAEDRLGKLSAAFATTKDPAIYTQWRQAASIMGPQAAAMPETLSDPADLDGAVKTATAWAQAYGAQKQQEGYTLSPGSKRFDASNKEVAGVPFAPERPDFQLYDGADGPAWLPKPTGAPLASASPPPGQGGFGIAETDGYVRNILGNAGQLDPNAAPEQVVQQLLPHVIKQESGGNPNAVSPKGAQGLMQVMPATGRDPGFGVRPMSGSSPEENVRFGRDYLTAMVKRYPGRPDLALAAYNAGPGVADRFSAPSAARGGVNAIPVGGVRPKPKAADAPSALQERIALARSMGASEVELRQMVIGKEGAAAGAKPMPVAALKIIQEETNAANTASAINTSLDKHLSRIDSGKLDFGPVANSVYAARNAAGMSTEESRNFAEFKSDLEKLRNDSLRLNAGVQTDGDAQRAWSELVANINDKDYVKQRLQTIRALNERARNLRLLNVDSVKSNYGRGEDQEEAPASGGWGIKLKGGS